MAAIQVPLLVAASAALLRGAPGVRWLRVMLVGLAWLVVDALLDPTASGPTGAVLDASVVPAFAVAGLLTSFFAAAAEVRRSRSAVRPALAGVAVLTGVFLVAPPVMSLGVSVLLWVAGTLHLGWTLRRAVRRHPGSLLDARLRLLAGAQWLLAAVVLGMVGGPFLVVWVLPMAAATLITVLAVAPPSFVRLTPSRTRAALRRTDTDVASVGPSDPSALRDAVEGVRALVGGEAALLVDDGSVIVEVGDQSAVRLGERWSADPTNATAPGPTTPGPTTQGPIGHELHPVGEGAWVLAGSTGRGVLVVVLSSVGVLLSRTDREELDSVAERLGVVLAREEARRNDERAAASMQAAERMRDDMLSTLSHELRTPLTTIMGFAEVLRSHADALSPERFRDMLDRLVEKGMQLELIVSGLLDLTAIRGRSEPERIAVYELRDLAEQAVLRRSDELSMREVSVEGDAGTVHTDGGAVLAVLEELLENVAKHTPRTSSVQVLVAGQGGEVTVEVRDDGPGLGGLGATEAFDPFVRGGDVLTRQTSGVGIGLTIARELAHQLGGTLAVRELEAGTSFVLGMPRHHDRAPQGRDRAPISAEHAVGDPTLVPSGRRGGASARALVRGSD